MTSAPAREASDNVAAALLMALRTEQSVEAIAAETVRAIRTTVPGYDNVSPESLERAVRNNIEMTTRVLRHARPPFAEDVPEAEALATERLEAGVPLGSLLSGFRLCLTTILHRLLELAPQHGISSETTLGFSTSLWTLGDAFSARAMQVYQDRAVADAVSDTARRLQWTVDAVVRGLPPEQLRRGAAVYGVPADRPLRAFYATSSSDQGSEEAVLQSMLGTRRMVASAPHGGGLIGILVEDPVDADRGTAAQQDRQAQPPEQNTPGLTRDRRIALGSLVPLERLPESYAAAARIDEAAAGVGESGVIDLEALSWRMAITACPDTTRLLQQRWMAPLEREGAFCGQIIEALIAYLENGLSIPRAAASIPVHANTLRYRLRRFADLTGAELESADTIVELAWVLAARRGQSSSL